MAVAAEHSELQWAKASSRTYERSLDDMERFFGLAGEGGVGATDGQHWHISVMAKIKTTGLDLRKVIPTAWKNLRGINPCLSAVVRDNRWIYTVADEQELESWLEETLHFHDTPSTSRDMFPIRNFTGRAVLHVLLQTQELYLLAPHTHLDGIGAYTAMSNLIQALADAASTREGPTFGGNEAQHLVPPLNFLADISAVTDANKSTFKSMLGSWMAGFAGVKLQHNRDTKQPCGDPKILYAPFSVEESKRIVARCKELGLTVTAAVQAAVSTALRKQVNSTATIQSAVTIHDVRKWVDKSKYPATALVGALAVPVPAVFTLTDDFVETAQLAKQKYRDPDQTGLLRTLPSFWGNEMVAIMTSPPPGAEAPSSLGLSSFGIMDSYIKPSYQGATGSKTEVKVEDAWVGITLYSPDILLHLWTLQGAMRLQCVYNEAYFDKESVAALLKATENELLLGLGLVN
ncbi:loline biosynthesis cluster 1 transcription factor lolU1 [Colletotrichum spaethianum]|uniref:Loline biosynthesis cluster 1 transcription factor lolU1 n=1 Tax=Colletotrichum spaethianum TaxID=700344 RepID=A0AA37PCM6_9PEZI|nr:loline biosynthesis cluster 1 transcription factor lolU1 [Colletotrichum spaethianum]GKT49749.1 loline biosynthesis cluster 1 transcription factor lolU1 [Colletotrichum spaethianum]